MLTKHLLPGIMLLSVIYLFISSYQKNLVLMKRILLFLFLPVAFIIIIIQWIKNYVNQQNLVMKRKMIIINIMKTRVSALRRLNNGKSIKNYHSRIRHGQNNWNIVGGILKLQNDSAFRLLLNVKFSFPFKEIKSICCNWCIIWVWFM